MQSTCGPSDLLEISSADIPLMAQRQKQLESRASSLAAEASKCRTEVNLTLDLLRAVRDAEGHLSGLTMNLNQSTDQLRRLAPDDHVQLRQIVFDLEAQHDNIEQCASQDVPRLQSIAGRFPGNLNEPY